MRRLFAYAVLLALWLCTPATAAGFDPFSAVSVDGSPGARVPLDGVFRDETGRQVSIGSLAAGQPVVLAPVLHNCPNICGVTLASLGDAVDAQAPDAKFVVIAFGIDPHETPGDARASLAELARRRAGAASRPLHALTGGTEAIRAVTEALGYHYAFDPDLGQYAHSAALAVLTPDGRLVRWLSGLAPDPADLDAALADARAGRVGGVAERLLLLCYHYDPVTGRYTLLVGRVIQIAGVATVLALVAFVGLALRRERRTGGGAP